MVWVPDSISHTWAHQSYTHHWLWSTSCSKVPIINAACIACHWASLNQQSMCWPLVLSIYWNLSTMRDVGLVTCQNLQSISYTLTLPSKLTLNVPFSLTRIFLAARSLCTKLFSVDKYSIPEAICRQYPSSCWGNDGGAIFPGLNIMKYVHKQTKK